MGDGGEGKATMKKEAKETTTTKKANSCALPRIYKEPQVFSAKATLSTYCDGNVGIFPLSDELFSQLKKFPKDFFLFYSSSTQKFHVYAGKDVFPAKSVFYQRHENGGIAQFWNHISHLEKNRGFVLSNNLLSQGNWQELKYSSKVSLVEMSMFLRL